MQQNALMKGRIVQHPLGTSSRAFVLIINARNAIVEVAGRFFWLVVRRTKATHTNTHTAPKPVRRRNSNNGFAMLTKGGETPSFSNQLRSLFGCMSTCTNQLF